MENSNIEYNGIARPFNVTTATDMTFDLVYCSNVVEHISDPISFCKKLISLSRKYVVIQAPYNEREINGSLITCEFKREEHINTIDENLIEQLYDGIDWNILYSKIPYARPRGKQIFFVGKLNKESFNNLSKN